MSIISNLYNIDRIGMFTGTKLTLINHNEVQMLGNWESYTTSWIVSLHGVLVLSKLLSLIVCFIFFFSNSVGDKRVKLQKREV